MKAHRYKMMWIKLVIVVLTATASCNANDRNSDFSRKPSCEPVTPEQNADHRMPDFIKMIEEGSYTMLVEMTSLTENATYYVEEVRERRLYHQWESNTAAVSVRQNGSHTVYHYYPLTDTFVVQEDDKCRDLGLDRPGAPWGWFEEDPDHHQKSFGPASILRLAHYINKEFVTSDADVEGVLCDRWRACEADGSVEIMYSLSSKGWNMPESNWFSDTDEMMPVQMDVHFEDESQRYVYNILEFVPYIKDHSLLETPRGLSCEGLVGVVANLPVPQIPWHFSLAEEIVLNPTIDGINYGRQHLDKIKFTYAGNLSLIRFDMTMPVPGGELTGYDVEVIHDFNTGAQYIMNKEFGNCTIGPIPKYSLDTHYNSLIGTGGSMLGPNELFFLDDTYAYVGERLTRGLGGDLWTSTRDDIPDPAVGGNENMPKAVLEYYFSQGVELTPSGKVPLKMPIRNDFFAYNHSDPNQVTGTMTTNFYDFKEVNLYTEAEFSVEECYEKYDDRWSYLLVFFPADHPDQFTVVQRKEEQFKHNVFALLVTRGDISPVRIASIDISLGTSGAIKNTTDSDMIIASVKLLDRAPYLLSYSRPEDEPLQFPGDNQRPIERMHFSEECAALCTNEKGFDCKSFHHCDDNICYLSALDTADGKPVDTVSHCEHWISSLTNQTFLDLPSTDAYKHILEAIHKQKFIFSIPFKNYSVGFEASMSFLYRSPDPMDPIRMQFYFAARDMSVKKFNVVIESKSLDECLILCVGWRQFTCETIVHLRDDNQCLLLATHYENLNSSDLQPHSHAYVHARSYLVDYNPIFGGVALNTSGPIYENVEHLEKCARLCSQETSIECQSFEWCYDEKVCHLHSEHFLDVADGDNYLTHTSCIHFSTKTDDAFSRHEHQGMPSALHQIAAFWTSASSCAKLCLEDTKEVCQSFDHCSVCKKGDFDVCGTNNNETHELCFLGTHHLGEPGVQLVQSDHCDHYSREFFGDLDYPAWIATHRQSSKPYTSGSMAGLAFGMIFLGILLAVAFLVAMMKFKPTSVPKDFSIAFVNLKNSGGESEM